MRTFFSNIKRLVLIFTSTIIKLCIPSSRSSSWTPEWFIYMLQFDLCFNSENFVFYLLWWSYNQTPHKWPVNLSATNCGVLSSWFGEFCRFHACVMFFYSDLQHEVCNLFLLGWLCPSSLGGQSDFSGIWELCVCAFHSICYF